MAGARGTGVGGLSTPGGGGGGCQYSPLAVLTASPPHKGLNWRAEFCLKGGVGGGGVQGGGVWGGCGEDPPPQTLSC